MERSQLGDNRSYGFDWLRRLRLRRPSHSDSPWKGTGTMTEDDKGSDVKAEKPAPELDKPSDTDKLAFAHSQEIDALKTRLTRAEAYLGRIIGHLDPHGTSAAFHDEKGEWL